MKKYHNIENLRIEDDLLILAIDGEKKSFKFDEISSALEKASAEERNAFEISPSGYGIHWPLLDEDISIDGLLGILHSPSQQRRTA